MGCESPLRQLQRLGQSVWYDNIRRGLITSGELQQLIDRGIVGVTSNPTIFQRAIAGSTDYEDALRKLALAGHSAQEIYEILAIEDIRAVADLLAPVYERTDGRDGYVSIEVSPDWAHDTQRTIEEAKRLRAAIGRQNVMIKVPATPAGIPAIEQLIADGVNVNVTLIFALGAYEQVVGAYIAGLERRMQAGQPLANVASVASIFVSRIDTAVDALLEERLRRTTDPSEQAELQALLGKAAIANSKVIYRRFQQLFQSPRFRALMERGARVQRPLWASTSTKNPAYRDVMYVEELIGPDTVNTMPPVTIQAFDDHGVVRQTVTEGVDEAEAMLERLTRLGIDLDAVMQRLLDEGVKAFADSFHGLMDSIEAKRQAVLASRRRPWIASLDTLQEAVDARLEMMVQNRVTARIWAKEASLWKEDPAHQGVIRRRLGWLHVTEEMRPHVAELQALAQEVWDEGFRHVMLLGMGGSSLCVEVFRQAYGAQPGAPTLWVLDTTHPDVIHKFEAAVDLPRTLFIVASKSGTTTEVAAFDAYFFERVRAVRGDEAGRQFIAITDPGTPLAMSAEARGFRRIVLNPPDIGGRYSGLSYFGLVPAVLAGVDIARLLAQGDAMAKACQPEVPVRENPGAWLGAILGEAALAGRDKATILVPPPLESFGLWAEQLIAESTGKEGKGIVPIAQEPVGSPEVYGRDRLFLYLTLEGEDRLEEAVTALETARHPVVRLRMPDISWIGAEFYRWEMATAVAGTILGINPFDEPNVQESKENTRKALEQYITEGCLPQEKPTWEADGVLFFGERGGARSWEEALRAHLRSVQPGEYIAWMAYLDSTGLYEEALQSIRTRVRNALRVATTMGYGPRFLHSTGQLHKGGPNRGIFVQLTADPMVDLPIPGQPYSFGTLIAAQALGDWQSLRAHGRRVVRLHLGQEVAAGLAAIQRALERLI